MAPDQEAPIQPGSGTPVSLIQNGSDMVAMPGAATVSLDTSKDAPKEEAPAGAPKGDDAPKDAPKEEAKDAPKEETPKDAPKEGDKPKSMAEAKPEDIERIKANLKEAGGFYADERYEAAALEFEILGEVSPETITKTATAFNVPEDMVKEFIKGAKATRDLQDTRSAQSAQEQQAATDKVVQEVLAIIPGGEKGLEPFNAWAKENIPQADRNQYDALLDSNPDAAKLVLQGFVDRFKAAGNGAPRDLTQEGGPGPGAAPQGYASQAEMERDMNDTRYLKGDEAFHAQVRERLAHSKW